MTGDAMRWAVVQRFLGKEALLLDERRWDEWLSLYDTNVEYWVPSWDDDGGLTENPDEEISLIYYRNRGGLEDRIFRIRTGKSAASTPAMWTHHMFTLLNVEEHGSSVTAKCNWTTHSYREDMLLSYRGWSEYELAPHQDSWVIMKKRTVILNPVTDTVIDFYNI